MLHLREKLGKATLGQGADRGVAPHGLGAVVGVLTLPFEQRRKSRQRAVLDDGQEVAVELPRGTILCDGEFLLDAEQREAVLVRAAPEALSVVRADDPWQLARAAYHLGNRHVPLQLGPGWIAYRHDHVLDGLVHALGMSVELARRPFEPEAGGYEKSAGHDHLHDHAHGAGHVRADPRGVHHDP